MVSFIGFCMLLVSFTTEIKQKLKMIETIIRSETDKKGKLSSETKTEIKSNLCEFVRLHSDAKQLSESNISM